MSLVINTNLFSLTAQTNLNRSTNALSQSVDHLSSGLRITRASDDAAGLAVSSVLEANIASVNQAVRNANDGVSLTQIADGAASTIGSLLSRLRELATQSASGTVGSTDRSYLDNEFVALRSEIDRIASVTEFNGTALLSGASTSFVIQIGFRSSANDSLTVNLPELDISTLGLSSVNISSSANAQSALGNIDSAISAVASARASYGADQNRLTATINALQVTSQNFSAADSQIRDADIASETAQFTKNQILVQSGIAILAQANSLPQQALALLR
jgi:flagellin